MIGESADIVVVDLGHGVQAQYVTGSWVNMEDGSIESPVNVPGTMAQRIWDSDSPFHHLRWEHAGMMYSIITMNPQLEQADLTAIAISMMEQIAFETR